MANQEENVTIYVVKITPAYTMWFNTAGKLHRKEGPAIIHSNGSIEWYEDGERHRSNGPAIEYATGTKEYWVKGKRHRDIEPAIEWSSGDKDWYINGVKIKSQYANSSDEHFYQANYKFKTVFANGNVEYYNREGNLHRDFGPAVIKGDILEYYNNGVKIDKPTDNNNVIEFKPKPAAVAVKENNDKPTIVDNCLLINGVKYQLQQVTPPMVPTQPQV